MAASEGLGQGSEVHRAHCRSASSPAGNAAAAGRGAAQAERLRKILVVDDNVDMAHSLATTSRASPVTSTSRPTMDPRRLAAARGFAARGARYSTSACPALTATAVDQTLLPNGGFEGHVRLIAVSGYGRAEDRSRAKAAGFDHHLVKPVDFSQLVSVLARA